ncbi:unnamed protein product [Rotaria sp. Silwood2]|nr:unnamed protein product [Rotaria sp. Silwood2]
MLGIGDKNEELKNNLVQIETGEGRSVTLGATALILALLGFDVYYACYSEYLSQRDYNGFLKIFDTLGITQNIRYGTFNKLCAEMINRNEEISQSVEQFISNGSNNIVSNSQRIERAKILLIDEVDVFFSQDFYGNVCTPSASLRDPTITSLTNFIWTQRKSKLNLNQVKATPEYVACSNRFPNREPLILEAVKSLIYDVISFESHNYIVKEDNIVYNVVYGYKTLFAYYCEHEKGKITKNSLEERINVNIKCDSFSRGTDFICYDKTVEKNGGTNVIQIFLSEEFSEEIQIKGRTARQGDYGSYSMVLLDSDLEKFLIQREDIEDVKKGKRMSDGRASVPNSTKTYNTVYELLHDKRNALFTTQYENNTKFVQQAKDSYEATQEFLKRFNTANANYVKEFLVKKNKGANIVSSQSQTICLMDATVSMTHLLHNCKNTVGTMFEGTTEILRDNNISEDSFQIQYVVYRNYNSVQDKIFQFSPWETRADNLRAFMNTINVEGGWGNEAVEIGLCHANKENQRENITQIILIGDAHPNTKAEVKQKRSNGFGEAY